MGCVALLTDTLGAGFGQSPHCTVLAAAAAPIADSTPSWTIAAVWVAVAAVLVALFKDEIWHWLHAPRLDVDIASAYGSTDLQLVIRNKSKRMAAEGVTVRIVQTEAHPIEYARGPKWMPRYPAQDQLLPRISGETTFALPPFGQVHVPLVTLRDGWTSSDAAVALVATDRHPENDGDERAGLVILPSEKEREAALSDHSGLERTLSSPAMIRFEIAAENVPARAFTLKLWRAPDRPPREKLPMSPGGSQVFRWSLEEGFAPFNWAPHGSSPEAKQAGSDGREPPSQPHPWSRPTRKGRLARVRTLASRTRQEPRQGPR